MLDRDRDSRRKSSRMDKPRTMRGARNDDAPRAGKTDLRPPVGVGVVGSPSRILYVEKIAGTAEMGVTGSYGELDYYSREIWLGVFGVWTNPAIINQVSTAKKKKSIKFFFRETIINQVQVYPQKK